MRRVKFQATDMSKVLEGHEAVAEQAKKAMTFYRFVPIADPVQVRSELLQVAEPLHLKGTILLAKEGVNGTLVGTQEDLETMAQALVRCAADMPFKFSDIDAENQGFFRFKIKLKEEIVTFGVPELNVADNGEHVDAETWNRLLNDPEVVVVDTRNQYEIDIGSFPGAISPETTNFREFPAWADEHLAPDQKVAMFCTGGIRCEKASAYLKQCGFENVYQLDGGVLKYLEDVEQEANAWQGECFVFDQRVSVNAELEQGAYQQCFACRHPVSEEDMQSEHYEPGICCPHCIDRPGSRQRFADRQKQIELAKARGEQHLGGS